MNKASFSGIEWKITILSVLIMLLPGTISLDNGGATAITDDVPSRGEGTMGEWDIVHDEWPVETDEAFTMYNSTNDELVVFYRDNGDCQVWSHYLANGTWVKIDDRGDPPDYDLFYTSFASDDSGNKAMFFGGYDDSYNDHHYIFFHSNDTWVEFDMTGEPGARIECGTTYDHNDDTFYLFGGRVQGSGWSNNLYSFNLTEGWASYSQSSHMEGRDECGMTITEDGKHIYVGPGEEGGDDYIRDLWHYDLEADTWEVINSDLDVHQEAMYILQYSPSNDDLLMTLGYEGFGSGRNFRLERLNDTYRIDRVTGEVTEIHLDHRMVPRYVSAWDMDRTAQRLIVLGSKGSGSGGGLQDIWSISVDDLDCQPLGGYHFWTGGTSHTGYDSNENRLYALKAHQENHYYREDYTRWQVAYYDYSTDQWSGIDIDQDPAPIPRDGMSSAFDVVENRFYLYGGEYRYWHDPSDEYHYYFYSEFWELDVDTGQWDLINSDSPAGARSHSDMVVDPENRMLYLFGGRIAGGDSQSLHRYNISGNAWAPVTPSISPPARMRTTLHMVPERNGFYLYGGVDNGTSSSAYNDLWFYHADKNQWQQKSGPSDPPDPGYDIGISYSPDTGEVIVFGEPQSGDSDKTFMLREGWLEWEHVETSVNPGDIRGHGMMYSTDSGTHLLWGGGSYEVWEFEPILRTPALEIKLLDPEGNRTNKAFPSTGTYTLIANGITDLPGEDLLGIEVNMTTSGDFLKINWDRVGQTSSLEGNTSWFSFADDPSVAWTDDEWEFRLPLEVRFDAPDGANFGVRIDPITDSGLSERSRSLSLFTVISDLEVVGYEFSTPLQERITDGDWIFGRTNLTASNFTVSFQGESTISPGSGSYRITMTTSSGDTSSWDYVPNTAGTVAVPVSGVDGENFRVWLNLTTFEGGIIHSSTFDFNLDLDPPTAPSWVKVRDESVDDPKVNLDNDKVVYLTWGSVSENGSGLKGICYSLDENLYPAEENLTYEFPEITIYDEGRHTFYVWAVDNTSRAGPYVEVDFMVDTHMVVFEMMRPDPEKEINLTDTRFTFEARIVDELSGVNLSSIEYQQSLPDRTLSDWRPLDVSAEDINNVTIRLTLDLVPGIKNIIGLRARDVAENDIRQSDRYGVYCFPGLATPQAHVQGPDDGETVEDTVTLEWQGRYIYPSNLSFEVHILDPMGVERTIDTGDWKMEFQPAYPGVHEWWIVSRADGKTNETERRTFVYEAPDIAMSAGGPYSVIMGDEIAVEITLGNPLAVMVNVSIDLEGQTGLSLKEDADIALDPGEERTLQLVLLTSDASTGPNSVSLNATDEFGRSSIATIDINIDPADEDTGPSGSEDDGPSVVLFIAIAAAVVLVLVAIVVFLMLRKKGQKEQEEIHVEEPEDREPSLDYDPTGVVAQGSDQVDPDVPMAPGALQQRESQSNVMEISIPGSDEEE